MKTKAVAMFVVGVCIMAWGCGVSTQQAEAQFRVLEEIYIAPGTAEEFEAASKARTARMVAGNVAFGWLVSVTNDGVYRFVTQLEEDFSSVAEWREQIAAMPASPTPLQSESRAAGHTVKAMPTAPRSGGVGAVGLGGVGGAARVHGAERNTRDPSAQP